MPRQLSGVDVRRSGRARRCASILVYYVSKPCVITSFLLLVILSYVTIAWYGAVISPAVYRPVEQAKLGGDVTPFLTRHIEVISQADYELEAGWAVTDGRVDMQALRRQLQEAVTEVNRELLSPELQRLNVSSLATEPEVTISRCRKWTDPAANLNVTSRASVILVVGDASTKAALTSFLALMRHTPLSAVEEVLVVGAMRSKAEVLEILEAAMDVLPLLRVFRFPKVTDDFKVRTVATKFARSDLLIFLTAAVRVTPGWIHPLLARLTSHPSSIVVPNVLGQEDDVHIEGGLRMRREFALDFSTVWEQRSPSEVTSLAQEDFLPETLVSEYGMALTRTLYHRLREFDEFHGVSGYGVELTAFSLKATLCSEGVTRAVCSNVAMTPSHAYSRVTSASASHRYRSVLVELWYHDSPAHSRAYKCLLPKSRNVSLNYHLRKNIQGMRKWMASEKCRPIATLATADRPMFSVPESSAMHAGRVRLQARGNTELAVADDMRTLAFRPVPARLTAPFSLTGERFIYNRKCITMEERSRLVLTTCRQGDRRQKWLIKDRTVRPWTDQKFCLGKARAKDDQNGGKAAPDSTLVVPAEVFPCNDTSADLRFSFTFEFDPKCRK